MNMEGEEDPFSDIEPVEIKQEVEESEIYPYERVDCFKNEIKSEEDEMCYETSTSVLQHFPSIKTSSEDELVFSDKITRDTKHDRNNVVNCAHDNYGALDITTKSTLIKYTDTHANENITFVCNNSTNSVESEINPMFVHKNDKPFKCDYCEKSFSARSTLSKHTRSHTNEKPFKCDNCEKAFSEKCNLTVHLRTHTNEKPFKCDYCDKSFSQKSHVLIHTRTHTKEKPFKCDYCDKTFSQISHVNSHTRTHTNEKPFKCNFCEKSFSLKAHVISHTRTHTNEKPFKCDYCEKSFSHRAHVIGHTRTHTKEKPFKCDYCERSFSAKSTLSIHTRTHSNAVDVRNQFLTKLV